MAPRVGAIVIVAALITGVLALTHVGPFHSSRRAASTPSSLAKAPTDIRGTWNGLSAFGGEFYTETLHITHEDLSTGAFSATITSPVGVEAMTGTVHGTKMTFVITLGSGTDRGSATISRSAGKLRIQAAFSNPDAAHGSLVATRISG